MNRLALGTVLGSFILCSLVCTQTPAWPQFGGVGRTASLETQKLPDEFGPEKNVLWRSRVLAGSSSPTIWGDRIYLTGYEDKSLAVFCLDRTSGKQVWRTDFPRPEGENYDHPASSPAAPTVCTDGEVVIAYFGAYGLIGLDTSGKELWSTRYERVRSQFGHGTSPMLHKGAVYLARDVSRGSALYCYDAKTGDERWVTPRPEARDNYGTPIVWRGQLIVAGSSVVKAYDMATGKPLWWVQGLTAIVCTSPVASEDILYFGGWSTPNVQPDQRLASGFEVGGDLTADDLKSVKAIFAKLDKDDDGKLTPKEVPPGRAKDAFALFDFNKDGKWEPRELQGLVSFPTAPGKNMLVAIKPGGEGDVTETHVLWSKRRGIPYVASPLLYKGRLYYFKKGGFASCIDAKTGRRFYESKRCGVGGEYYATPIGVGNRVYVAAERGQMLVLDTGDDLEIVAKNDFGESLVATPAVLQNTMYIRTAKHLYAIREVAAAKRDGDK